MLLFLKVECRLFSHFLFNSCLKNKDAAKLGLSKCLEHMKIYDNCMLLFLEKKPLANFRVPEVYRRKAADAGSN